MPMTLVQAALATMEEEAREIFAQNMKNRGKVPSVYQRPELTREINGRQVRVLIVAAAGNRSSRPYSRWKVDGRAMPVSKVISI